jgi:hypothetical protein
MHSELCFLEQKMKSIPQVSGAQDHEGLAAPMVVTEDILRPSVDIFLRTLVEGWRCRHSIFCILFMIRRAVLSA